MNIKLDNIYTHTTEGSSTVEWCKTALKLITALNIIATCVIAYYASQQVVFTENYFTSGYQESISHDPAIATTVILYGIGVSLLMYIVGDMIVGIAKDNIYIREISLKQYEASTRYYEFMTEQHILSKKEAEKNTIIE